MENAKYNPYYDEPFTANWTNLDIKISAQKRHWDLVVEHAFCSFWHSHQHESDHNTLDNGSTLHPFSLWVIGELENKLINVPKKIFDCILE
jgi:hypothetical protein